MNDELFELSGEFLGLPFERAKLTGTTAEDYFFQLTEIDADWVINVDEDVFLIDPQRVLELLSYMQRNGYDCAGVPDGGVIDIRVHNPVVPNAFFTVHNNKRIKQKFDRAAVSACRFSEDLKKHTPQAILKNDKYGYDEFEPYYKYFFWLLKNDFRFLYLNGTQWPKEPVTTLLNDHENQPMLLHCWYARDYENQKQRFNYAVNFCRKAREKKGKKAKPPADPLVTIGIITHDRFRFLTEAVASALAQETQTSFEVLVVDNGSTDETANWLSSQTDPRLRFVRSHENLGEGGGRNMALDNMHGSFILWLDDDDILLKNAVASHLACLEKKPEADVVYGNLQCCDENLNFIEEWRYRPVDPNTILHLLLFNSPFPNGGTLIRRTLFENSCRYDPTLARGTDYDFWVQAACRHSNFVHHDDFVYQYRAHSGNFLRGEESPDFNDCNAKVVKHLLARAPLQALFPQFDWLDNERIAAAKSLIYIALVYSKYTKYERALQMLDQSFVAARTREGLVIRGMISHAQGDMENAFALLAEAVIGGNRELMEMLRLGKLV